MSRRIVFTPICWDEYQYWFTQDKKTLNKINRLIRACQADPFAGIGKPESLKYDLAGFWSRRIDDKHRLVYSVDDECLNFVGCCSHYGDTWTRSARQ